MIQTEKDKWIPNIKINNIFTNYNEVISWKCVLYIYE